MSGPIGANEGGAYIGNARYMESDPDKLKERRDQNGGANIRVTTGEDGKKSISVFASADKSNDEIVDLNEAKSGYKSIFSAKEQTINQDTLIKSAIDASKRMSADVKANAQSTVMKYLNGASVQNLLQNWSGFSGVEYKSVQVQNEYEATGTTGDEANGVQSQIDNLVESKLNEVLTGMTGDISSKFKSALDRAIAQAENELVGDADIVGKFNASDNDKKGISTQDLNNIKYQRTSDETGNKGDVNTNVATYNGSQGVGEASAGYNTTVSYLQSHGAKAETKLVNGKEQTVYKIKVDGKSQYVTVDDAGQVHTLSRDKGFLRESKFTTNDSIADARQQSRADGTADNDIPNDAKVKVRKVDGELQSVVTWKDKDGNKHARVIDHNEVTGLTVSSDVQHVSAGGRAKYSSSTSGLAAYDRAHPNDPNIGYRDGKFQDGTYQDSQNITRADYVDTERSRAKLSAANIGQAVSDIAAQVSQANGQHTSNGTVHEFTVNGHKYTLDTKDLKAAERTLRLIQGDLANTPTAPTPPAPQGTVSVDTSGVKYEDKRTETADNGKWGVNHDTLEPNSREINKIHYDSTPTADGHKFTRSNFQNEGWKASKGRADEKVLLKAMNDHQVDGKETTDVTGMKNVREFTMRFIEVITSGKSDFCKSTKASLAGKTPSNFNIDKLANAIKVANPSFFDAQGNMYKDCDFNRINFPRKLDAYLL